MFKSEAVDNLVDIKCCFQSGSALWQFSFSQMTSRKRNTKYFKLPEDSNPAELHWRAALATHQLDRQFTIPGMNSHVSQEKINSLAKEMQNAGGPCWTSIDPSLSKGK